MDVCFSCFLKPNRVTVLKSKPTNILRVSALLQVLHPETPQLELENNTLAFPALQEFQLIFLHALHICGALLLYNLPPQRCKREYRELKKKQWKNPIHTSLSLVLHHPSSHLNSFPGPLRKGLLSHLHNVSPHEIEVFLLQLLFSGSVSL